MIEFGCLYLPKNTYQKIQEILVNWHLVGFQTNLDIKIYYFFLVVWLKSQSLEMRFCNALHHILKAIHKH